ncbi:MAG TPA: ASCH domain-containing protein [Candidatus Bacteroides intestinigallinarum]|nr:ASCH domain-containing protein [Candidatus Bacteroides intestinigallinarum]
MKVLLSIKPEFAYKIFDGTKKYEFRKSIFKRTDVRKIIVYASAPIKKVIGEFTIEDILNDEVDLIWEQTYQHSGITRSFYQSYFENKEKAYAIKIGQTTRYERTKNLSDYNILVAPQSFVYLK